VQLVFREQQVLQPALEPTLESAAMVMEATRSHVLLAVRPLDQECQEGMPPLVRQAMPSCSTAARLALPKTPLPIQTQTSGSREDFVLHSRVLMCDLAWSVRCVQTEMLQPRIHQFLPVWLTVALQETLQPMTILSLLALAPNYRFQKEMQRPTMPPLLYSLDLFWS
jgi:hypothetical protein